MDRAMAALLNAPRPLFNIEEMAVIVVAASLAAVLERDCAIAIAEDVDLEMRLAML
jgi:hypothetical protein